MTNDTDRDFAVHFAQGAGYDARKLRTTARRRKKLDLSDVTDADELINKRFIAAVRLREGRKASVKGEEESDLVKGAKRMWVIDPVDGTREYVDDSIPYAERSACVGISLFELGVPVLAVAYNPFRNEMYVAERGLPTLLNGKVVTCNRDVPKLSVRYDYVHWDTAPFDLRGLRRSLGEPIGLESTIYQACQVAAGRSAFAAFPGNKIHDFVGALLVWNAKGLVTDLRGHPLDWNDLNHGVLYATPVSQKPALRLIRECLRK